MENITNNPGLQHLAEKILLNLDYEDLEICGMINQSCKYILENPIFWMKKCASRGMSKKNQTYWAKTIQSVKNSDMDKHIVLYLKWNLCYSDSILQEKFRQQICEVARSTKKASKIFGPTRNHLVDIIKILAPLTDNPNAPNRKGFTPIHHAASQGYTEIVQILAPLTDNPNVPNKKE